MAISVAPERILGPEASDVQGVRAAATLRSFTNALTVVLFGLIPGFNAGYGATVVAIVGLLFIIGALLRLFPTLRSSPPTPSSSVPAPSRRRQAVGMSIAGV